ncbi:MAG TPA: ABC transporter ATP-binding protein [Anaerolineales bacterium]|nr:ABC transporter ATP-binding protein [Anaerolineales bacterium]
MISVHAARKAFGDRLAVDSISFDVAEGEIYGLVGPDGAGKTTLMRLAVGALGLDSGEIEIAGCPISSDPEGARAHIGYLPQRFSLYEDLTVLENLQFFAEARALPRPDRRARIAEILSFVGLDEYPGRLAGRLSGGMKQKLGLAVALVHRPGVLLLDEPTTGVDPITRQDFWRLIIRLAAEEGVAVLVSTPYMDEAVRCRRLGFIRAGRLLLEGTPAQIRSRLEGRILELAGRPLPALRDHARSDPAVEDAQLFGDRLHLRVADGSAEAVIARLKTAPPAGAEIDTIRVIPSQLEDVFISLLRET